MPVMKSKSFPQDYTEPFLMFKFKLLLPAFIIYYITTLNLNRYVAATSVKSLCSAVTTQFYYPQFKKKIRGISSSSVFMPGN